MTPAPVSASAAGGSASSATVQQLLEQHAGLLIALQALLLLLGLVAGAGILLRLRARPIDWAARVASLSWRPWGGAELGWLLGILLVSNLGGGFLVGWLMDQPWAPDWDEGTVMMVSASLLLHGVALVTVWALLRRNRVRWSDAFGLGLRGLPRGAAQGVAFLLAALPVLVFYTLLYRLVLQSLGVEVNLQEQVELMGGTTSGAVRLYYLFLAGVLAPVVEELLFRGLLFPVLLQRLPLWLSLVVVSVLFAAIHVHLPSLAPLFVLSFAFCLAYLGTGSLWAPIVMHSLFNLSTMAVLYVLA